MKREISSSATPVYKAILLIAIGLWIIISAFSLIEAIKHFSELTELLNVSNFTVSVV